jgi:hypothetical protein
MVLRLSYVEVVVWLTSRLGELCNPFDRGKHTRAQKVLECQAE